MRSKLTPLKAGGSGDSEVVGFVANSYEKNGKGWEYKLCCYVKVIKKND